MKELLNRLQKDLMKLQSTVQKESQEVSEKLKSLINKGQLEAKGMEIEKLLEKKLQAFEPVFDGLVKELTKNAKKAGLDLSKFEKEVYAAKDKLKEKASDVKKSVVKKKKAAKKAKKTSSKKKVSKKKASKKSEA